MGVVFHVGLVLQAAGSIFSDVYQAAQISINWLIDLFGVQVRYCIRNSTLCATYEVLNETCSDYRPGH